jgi:hypothetical protein
MRWFIQGSISFVSVGFDDGVVAFVGKRSIWLSFDLLLGFLIFRYFFYFLADH